MKYTYIIIVILGIGHNTFAQNVGRAFNNLEKGEYDKARELFGKILAEDSLQVAANLGMALALADKKSPGFDIVGAWRYVTVVKPRLDKFTPEELDAIGEYFFAVETRKSSRAADKKIALAIDEMENQLIRYIREEHDLKAVNRIIDDYPGYKHYANVVHIRNQFEFYECVQKNTVDAYTAFIQKHPGAAQVKKALKMRDKLAFDVAQAESTEAAYSRFIASYPQSIYLQQAIKQRNIVAYGDIQKKNTLEAYENFITKYPEAVQVLEAKKHLYTLLYEAVTKTNDIAAYTMFVKLYPENEHFAQVFNKKATLLGKESFSQSGLASQQLLWAKTFDNNGHNDLASVIALTNDNCYVIAGTTRANDTASSDVWLLKLDKSGNLLWQKTIEQPFNEQVQDILVTSNNDIIVLGYEQATSGSPGYTGWFYKLDSKGARLMSKDLGNIRIVSSSITPTDKIYLSVDVKDARSSNFFIQKLDVKGNVDWSRKYVNNGVFQSITRASNNETVFAGDRWVMCADSNFYIKWEDTVRNQAAFRFAGSSADAVNLVGTDKSGAYFYSYSLDGTLRSQSSLFTDNSILVSGFETRVDNTSLLVCNKNNKTQLLKLDARGVKTSDVSIGGNYKVIGVVGNAQGETSYLLQGADYVVFTLSNAGF